MTIRTSIRVFACICSVLLLASLASARKKVYLTGNIVDMVSSDCGYDAKAGGNPLVGAVLGTEGDSRKAKVMLCKDYTLKSENTTFKIRPEKDHAPLLPVGAAVEFRIDKDKIKLRTQGTVSEMSFLVISEQAAQNSSTSDHPAAH